MKNKKKSRKDFKSDLEYCVWKNLGRTKVNRNIKYEYEPEVLPYQIVVNRNYTPDIVVHKLNGKKIYVEIKGYFRREDVQKMLHVKLSNPKLDIRMLFPKDNKMVGRKRMRYSDWCKKYKFKYCIGTAIPREWLV